MTGGIRRVGIAIVVAFLALMGQLVYLQVVRADEIAADPGNVRNYLRDLRRPRGPILTGDEEFVARSVPVDDEFEYQRQYPLGPLFAHVGGFQSIVFGNAGTEAEYNDELIGRDVGLSVENFTDLLSGQQIEGTVVLHLTRRSQEAARTALRGLKGSVVVMEARSGAVAAMYSEPSYDPNPLAGHDADAVIDDRRALVDDPAKPELARAWRERYPPGSTFKVVTTAIALDEGVATPETEYPEIRELPLPQTDRTIKNFGNSRCGGTLVESFVRSCNTTFAAIGLQLGERFASGIERFAVNAGPLAADVNPPVARSIGPPRGSFKENQPAFAQAAIGQGPIAVTPLEMAAVGAAVANGGEMPVPRVGAEIRDSDGVRVRRIEPEAFGRSMSAATATELQSMMLQVVEQGTGTAAQIPGVAVAGKTGTAQAAGGPPHAWFVGYAPADAGPGEPVYAVAVIVERGGDLGDEATGGRVAAPIAAQVLQAVLADPAAPRP